MSSSKHNSCCCNRERYENSKGCGHEDRDKRCSCCGKKLKRCKCHEDKNKRCKHDEKKNKSCKCGKSKGRCC
ncbi:hypothetical protein UT300018_19650 [Clostridium faecium]|nr:hypothetical protein [Clostridium argentinense]